MNERLNKIREKIPGFCNGLYSDDEYKNPWRLYGEGIPSEYAEHIVVGECRKYIREWLDNPRRTGGIAWVGFVSTPTSPPFNDKISSWLAAVEWALKNRGEQ